jgi:uncharacterized protein YqeY
MGFIMKEPLIEKLKNMLSAAILNRDEQRKSILKVLLADTQRLHSQPDDKQVISLARKLIEGNEQLMKYAQGEKINILKNENIILSELLPKLASDEEIKAILVTLPSMEAGLKEGQVIGLSIKKLTESGLEFDNKTAIKLIKEIISAKSN